MTFCRSDKIKRLHTWVQYFEFFRSKKGWQNLFQKRDLPVRKKTYFFSKNNLVPMSYIYICIICVLYVYYMCIIYVLYMYYIICIRSAFAGFCWLFLGLLGFFASAAIFVCAFAGFCWVFWRKKYKYCRYICFNTAFL